MDVWFAVRLSVNVKIVTFELPFNSKLSNYYQWISHLCYHVNGWVNTNHCMSQKSNGQSLLSSYL